MSRIEQVAAHLIKRGHISAGSAVIEYGYFRLPDVIHRLRNERTDLLPEGTEIVTVHKQDTKGANYGEYELVQKRSAKVRNMVAAARALEEAATPFQKQFAPGPGVGAQV